MKKELGSLIAEIRKEKGMTQLELAEKMGVTDKAVSKWERGLSWPDAASLPLLAEILGISLDELMQHRGKNISAGAEFEPPLDIILNCIALAMGVAVTVLAILNKLDARSGACLLGIGLTCSAIILLRGRKRL